MFSHTKLYYTIRTRAQMSTLQSILVTNGPDGLPQLRFTVDDGTFVNTHNPVSITDIWPAVIDLFLVYPDLQGFDVSDFIPPEVCRLAPRFPDALPTLKFQVGLTECKIGVTNGDSGETHWGVGRSFTHAAATVLHANGYKPTPKALGRDTRQWILEFEYGFQRASDEQLALEMEAITSPGKGSW